MVVPQFPDRATQIIPSDTIVLGPTTVYVGVAGDVAVEPYAGGNEVIFSGCPTGSVIPVRVRRVLATGTTALSLVGVT